MKKDSDLKKIVSGSVWKFMERVFAQCITLLVSIILARMLSPDDYGIVSIVTIFFTFSNILISGGLNTALIQKKDANEDDYNTVFTVSMLVAIIVYFALFLVAPIIARIYNNELLVWIIRVMGIVLPVNALKAIYCAHISSNMLFQKFFFATIGGTLFSAVVGIAMAAKGFGAWALVAQQLSNSIIDTLILAIIDPLCLRVKIVVERFKELFGYGSKILISNLIGEIYTDINPLFVGLKYSSADLSFYTRGKVFPGAISATITNTLSSVLFPMLSKRQDDKNILLNYTRQFMQISSFIVFPVLLGFFAVSDNFVYIVLTEKWMSASYYIRIFCISSMFDIVAVGNCETIKAMGRSDVYLKIEIIKKVGYFITTAVFIALSQTPEQLAISVIVCTVIQVLVNCVPNIKLLGYRIKDQLIDLLPNFVISLGMCICVMAIDNLDMNRVVQFALQIIVGVIVYLILNIITHNSSMKRMILIIKNVRR